VFFAGKSDRSFNVHGDILRKRMASGVGEGDCLPDYRRAPDSGRLCCKLTEMGSCI
jgi:hypothetical protein